MSSSPNSVAHDDQLDRIRTIARLNDELRCGRKRGDHNLIVTTNGVNEPLDAGQAILDQLFARSRLYAALAAWQPEQHNIDDERDYGSLDFEGTKLLFKIDYYARDDFASGSEDPAKPHMTCRVLTILLPSEY